MSDTPVDRTSMEPVGGVARAGPSAWALMLDLARQGATGRLDLTLETGVAVWVWLRDGQVCSVSGPHERPLLGATLLAGGVVTSEQLATALAVALAGIITSAPTGATTPTRRRFSANASIRGEKSTAITSSPPGRYLKSMPVPAATSIVRPFAFAKSERVYGP